jgi:hypothetical protein
MVKWVSLLYPILKIIALGWVRLLPYLERFSGMITRLQVRNLLVALLRLSAVFSVFFGRKKKDKKKCPSFTVKVRSRKVRHVKVITEREIMLNLLKKKRGEKPLPVLLEGNLKHLPDAQYPSELDMDRPYTEETPATMADLVALKAEIIQMLVDKKH